MKPLVLLTLLCVAAPTAAHARDEELVLPIAGLVVAKPTVPGREYRQSSTWGFAEMATQFESRDVIDEIDGGTMFGSVWVSVGWFAIGSCADVVADAPIDASWTATKVALWGARWTARGGIYRGGGAHDGDPVVTLCLERGLRKQLVVSRFVPAGTPTPTRPEMLALVRKDELVRRIHRAFRDDAVRVTAPARTASVEDHGDTPARRDVIMLWTGITLALPDDGFIWMTGSEASGIDRFERMAPALPELAMSVARVDVDIPCAAAFAQIDGPTQKPLGPVPAGWEAGPTAKDSGFHALSVCHRSRGGLIVVAVVTAARSPELGSIAALLEAIAAAADKPPVTPANPSREARTRLPADFLKRHEPLRRDLRAAHQP